MSKMKRTKDCSVDVIRNPFSLLDAHTLCEILARLPVKSLLQAKRVCRHWRSIVKDPYFVDLHYTRSKGCPKLLIFVSRSSGTFLFSVDLFERRVLLDQMKVELPWNPEPFQVMNPVNGLVCFNSFSGVVIYNPRTGDKTSLIKSTVPQKRPFYGFGFDSETKEHKVVRLWHELYPTRYETGASDFCEVLTVGQNTWRRIDDFPPYKAYGESVYVNGVVYWLGTYQEHHDSTRSADAKSIVAFDIGREKFRMIPIPDFIADGRQSYDNCHDLLVIDGSVGLLDRKLIVDGDNNNVIKMWLFHDDHKANTSNWTHEFILISIEWEKKWNNCNYTIPRSDLFFHAITGTNLIIMMPKQRRGVFSLCCYDRKTKTLDCLDINTVSRNPLSDYYKCGTESISGCVCGTFVESLYPVAESSRRDRFEEMKQK